jgi:hypothetical protein
MSTSNTLSAIPFLNRIALETMQDPMTVDPYFILEQLFEFAEPEEYIELFDQFSICAMNDNYSWNEGGPGNLLFICEKFELFAEVCYLLHLGNKDGNKTFATDFKLIDEFFHQYTIQQWKKEFHDWVESAFADFSAMENIEAKSLLKFQEQTKNLLKAFS